MHHTLLYYFTYTCIIVLLAIVFFNRSAKRSAIPLVNSPRWFWPKVTRQIEFIRHGQEILLRSRKSHGDAPFRAITELGEMTILPPSFAHTLRKDGRFDFAGFNEKIFHSYIRGLEPLGVVSHGGHVLQSIITQSLNKHLDTIVPLLCEETLFAQDLIFGQSPSKYWSQVSLSESILDLVTRLFSRVFVGEEISHNEEWIKVVKEYLATAVVAVAKLNMIPRPFKNLFSWFSDDCKRAHNSIIRARNILTPVLENRRLLKEKARTEDRSIPYFNDAIEWAEVHRNGKAFDTVHLQFGLVIGAVSNTANLIRQVLVCLASEPELIIPLREEIIGVLRAHGWSRNALHNMKLLDSAIKEAQRLKPTNMLTMRRLAIADADFPGGLSIRKGQLVGVDATNLMNPDIYPEPRKYDIYRFKRMGDDPLRGSKAQLVSTSPDHFAFGHGKHACPGRFFAADGMKIVLCHLLVQYEWKLVPGVGAKHLAIGSVLLVNPAVKLMYKRREEGMLPK
ncbi:cytochrome P450 monooxygenase-like protein [Phaeosphaeriaceae sp. PMI808]|nr:cytochrome P450 monooxygenase-like protein [Phaeosphaeriaceae sp. PMI808]